MKQQTDNPLDENGYPIYGSFSPKKQTAVDWLINQIPLGIRINLAENGVDFQQAKAMEKKRIEDTYWDAYKEGQCSSDKTAEEYYNETFNK